jgi:hypothetical protein
VVKQYFTTAADGQGFRRLPGSQLRMSGAEEKTGQKPSSTPS